MDLKNTSSNFARNDDIQLNHNKHPKLNYVRIIQKKPKASQLPQLTPQIKTSKTSILSNILNESNHKTFNNYINCSRNRSPIQDINNSNSNTKKVKSIISLKPCNNNTNTNKTWSLINSPKLQSNIYNFSNTMYNKYNNYLKQRNLSLTSLASSDSNEEQNTNFKLYTKTHTHSNSNTIKYKNNQKLINRTVTNYCSYTEQSRKKINLKLLKDLQLEQNVKKASTDYESMSYKSTDTGPSKQNNIYNHTNNKKCNLQKQISEVHIIDIENYKNKQRSKLQLPQTKQHVSDTSLKMISLKENAINFIHNKITEQLNEMNTSSLKIFENMNEYFNNTYNYFINDNYDIKNNYKNGIEIHLYKHFFLSTSLTFYYNLYEINTHHLFKHWYYPIFLLYEFNKKLSNENNEHIEQQINDNDENTLLHNFHNNKNIHNLNKRSMKKIFNKIPPNKCKSISCEGHANLFYIFNSLHKTLPLEMSLDNLTKPKDVHSPLSSTPKIINLIKMKKKFKKQSFHKPVSFHNTEHNHIPASPVYRRQKTSCLYLHAVQEKVDVSLNKIKHFSPTNVPSFYSNNYATRQNELIKKKIKESFFKTNNKIIHYSQNSKLYNKLCRNILTAEASKNRTQEMISMIQCNHNLSQLIVYIHSNQKVAFVSYFNKNKCKDIINHCDANGNVLLTHAIKHNEKDIFHFLIENGADVNIGNNYGNTPLHFAFSYKHFHFVNELIKNQANELKQNIKGFTPWECMGLACD